MSIASAIWLGIAIGIVSALIVQWTIRVALRHAADHLTRIVTEALETPDEPWPASGQQSAAGAVPPRITPIDQVPIPRRQERP